MQGLEKYRRRSDTRVVAVQLDLDTDGFTYQKWGDTQRCRAGDWLVNNGGEVYTVDREVFESTYGQVGPGIFEKVAPVWAEPASADGTVQTKEGVTHYKAGDYVVFNDAEGQDGYAMDAETFHRLYQAD